VTGAAIRPILGGLLVAVGAAIAGALWMIALRPPPPEPAHFSPAAAVNSIQAVTLTSGQIYFGTLRAVTGSDLVLVDVFEIRSTTNPQTNERTVQLVPRRAANWDAPVDMAIPFDKILFTESVGRDSAAARQIAAASATPPEPPGAREPLGVPKP
jgi:hypothetical protein